MDYDEAASYWEKQDAKAKRMDRDALMAKAEEFLAAHNTCALATGHGGQVRCTPIEYTYRQGCFWLLSEGGEKFRNLKIRGEKFGAPGDGHIRVRGIHLPKFQQPFKGIAAFAAIATPGT